MYNFYKGDACTKGKPILASHGWNNRKTKGDYFFIYPYENNNAPANVGVGASSETFSDLDLNPSVCDNLEAMDIRKPLEIQSLGIPKILQGHNVLLAAETGCGKTLAYLLPLVTKIMAWKQMAARDINCPLGLIVTPSRELTVQIALVLIKVSKHLGINTKIITGGRTKRLIMDPPTGHVDVLVCSFGVISKLTTLSVYNLQFVRLVVLDEADSLFHCTFEEKLRVFMRRLFVGYFQETSENELPTTAQLILSSATIPSRLENVLHDIVNLKSLAHVTTEKLHTILVPQKFIKLIPSQKPIELLKYIKPKVLNKQRVIVFSNRNTTSTWLYLFLHECGISVTNLHGDMPLRVRRGKYGEFLNGKTMVLSTTNGGSRGLDTIMVNHILNYDFPLDTSAYIHRCGRTGREGTVGDSRVTNFISRSSEVAVVQKIEMAVRKMKPLPIFNLVESDEMEEEEIEDNYVENIIENLDDPENIPY
ncbi:putative ATP-dependent RNA helicase Dbp21E2 [Xylocopa sonorina]|uniref:putative ATP-dependent RNA helicase Dbp21E2 n=1 Tax=Xylocopa sonorina TaxID=1818115 RepID=UPI00403AA1E7